MDDMYHKGRNQHTIPGVLRDPSGKAVQPQPVSYETTPIPEDNGQSSFIYDNVQGSFGIPGGAETFIKARPDVPPVQPKQNKKLRTGQAYLLLAVAIIAVLIASSVLAAFLATGNLGALAHHTTPNQPLTKAQATATARSTQGHTTTAPKPAPTQGSTQANPPATPQPTQTSQNPGGNPTPNPGASSLPQFLNLPQQMSYAVNNRIIVQTQPGAIVQLTITYSFGGSNGLPTQMQQTADNSGMATFDLGSALGSCSTSSATVNFVAIAPDSNGVQVQLHAAIPTETCSN